MMKICRECGSLMPEVYSFSPGGKRERYNECRRCHGRTRKNKLTDKEIEERFGYDGGK